MIEKGDHVKLKDWYKYQKHKFEDEDKAEDVVEGEEGEDEDDMGVDEDGNMDEEEE